MLTKKGDKIMDAMESEYGSDKKTKQVFYASRNKGTIKGVEKGYHKKKRSLAEKAK